MLPWNPLGYSHPLSYYLKLLQKRSNRFYPSFTVGKAVHGLGKCVASLYNAWLSVQGQLVPLGGAYKLGVFAHKL